LTRITLSIFTLYIYLLCLYILGFHLFVFLCTHQSHDTFFFFSHLLSTLFKSKNNRNGQPKEHTTIDRDNTALASSSSFFFAQDEHQNVAQDSPSIVKGVVASSASSYNDLFDTGILSKIRSRGAKGTSTNKQQQYYKTHAARMRLLASDVKQSDSPSTTFSDVGSMPRLDFSSEKLSHMSRKSSMDSTPKGTSAKSTKLSAKSFKTTKASKSSNNGGASTTTVVSTNTVTQPALSAELRALLSGRNLQLQENAGLSQEAVEAYEATFLQELQQNPPAGTTVSSVDITSIKDDGNGNLVFTFNTTSVVDCPAPCDQAQAEAESAAALEAVLATSVSSGDFAMALQANLANVTNCGEASNVTCADLQASAANATVGIDFSSLDVCPSTKVVVCENGIATSVGGVAMIPGITCKDACGGNCCVGANVPKRNATTGIIYQVYKPACDGLTASICMDGETCMGGASACKDTNVTGSIFLGCNGRYSCSNAGKNGGYIGSITKSCFNLGTGLFSGACYRAAEDGGYIGSIANSCTVDRSCRFAAKPSGFIGQIVGSCNEYGSCNSAAYQGGKITLGIVDSCKARVACRYSAAYGGDILTIDNACNSDYACYYAGNNNVGVGDIPSGIIECCNIGNATSSSEGICYKADETTLFTQDQTCSASAPVSVSAMADSGSDLINKDEVALGDFLTDLAYELYKLVKELTKNKKD